MLNILKSLSQSREGGYITRSSLSGSRLSQVLEVLGPLQDQFFKLYKRSIPSAYSAKWPLDKLHWWSRPQEYAFVLFHVLSAMNVAKRDLKILEFGPGCSFIPYVLASVAGLKNLHIEDNDDDVVVFWKNIGRTFGLQVDRSNSSSANKEVFDIIYSISVIEHVESPVNAIKELINQLAPDGQLILTVDVDLSNFGQYGLTKEQLSEILQIDEINFESVSASAGCPHIHDLATPKDGWVISPLGNTQGSRYQPISRDILSWLKTIKRAFRGQNFDSSDICVLKLIGTKLL
jgi:SAM-dependent methyltransferase